MRGGDWHAHECRVCGTIWEHETCYSCSSDEYHALHDCPECGENERQKVWVGNVIDWPRPIGAENVRRLRQVLAAA